MANSNRTSNQDTNRKKAQESKARATKAAQQAAQEESRIPGRAITALASLLLFVLLVIVWLNPEGFLLLGLRSAVEALMGKPGFYLLIPSLALLFTIQITSRGKPVLARSICVIAFVLLAGAFAHLCLPAGEQAEGSASFVLGLIKGGSQGTTGGLLCGLIGEGLRVLVGKVVSLIVLLLGAVLVLLGSLRITIPAMYRAYRELPKKEKEIPDEPEIEPSARLVHSIANRVDNRRQIEPQNPPKKREKPRREENHGLYDYEREAPIPPAIPVPVEVEPEPVPVPIPEPVVEQPKPNKVTAREAAASAVEVAQEIALAEEEEVPQYSFPPINLLKRPTKNGTDGTEEMRENTRRLNETLASFKIDAQIINVTRGPSVTRYEVELAQGVRLNKLTTCADDIALSLGASGVRIAAVTGKIAVVGIEVPNRNVNTVTLREVIDSPDFTSASSKSSFAVGKDIGGKCIVGNIAKLPHMLIAGTTGSGKSVCMNSIIISLLYKASPEDVKLIMVDPKMVELGIYNGIPHLLIPVVTDPKKAAGSLQWAVTEMLRRYRSMSDAGVRDLDSYNAIVESQGEGTKLPQIVVIIDELADLMLVAAKEVEESICRIAQMGRAAGIHLIIATQRPSADVITGLMKANIPSRIAFAVASAMESRIILDTQGAEKLVGKGDMLFSPIGSGKPKRVQGCFVSDGEVEAVATYVKEHYLSTYDQQVMEEIDKKAEQTGSKAATASDPEPNSAELEGDPAFRDAVDAILDAGQASVSLLQRRLKLGYAHAARVMDEMEEKGIVGPFVGSKPRAILVTKEQWRAMQDGAAPQMSFADIPEDDFAPVPEEIP